MIMADTDPSEFRFTLPEKQPFEGKATQKQKHRIWQLGLRDEELIRSLGKQQAACLIDALYRHHRQNKVAPGVVLLAILFFGALLCFVAYKLSGGD
jgi:hypothetical protein